MAGALRELGNTPVECSRALRRRRRRAHPVTDTLLYGTAISAAARPVAVASRASPRRCPAAAATDASTASLSISGEIAGVSEIACHRRGRWPSVSRMSHATHPLFSDPSMKVGGAFRLRSCCGEPGNRRYCRNVLFARDGAIVKVFRGVSDRDLANSARQTLAWLRGTGGAE